MDWITWILTWTLIIISVSFLVVTVYFQKSTLGEMCETFCHEKFNNVKGWDTGTFGMNCRCLKSAVQRPNMTQYINISLNTS